SGGGPWRAEAHIASLDGDEPFATVLGSNPLGAAAPVPSEALRGPRVVLPSGWLEDDDEGSGVDPRTWGPRGWAGFEAICRGLCEQVRGRSTRVCFRPRATDVLSDVPSCLRFLESKA